MPDMPVELYLGDPMRASTVRLDGRTGSDGAVVFHLDRPLPSRLFVGIIYSGKFAQCSPGWFSTDTVVAEGVVGEYRCGKRGKPKGKLAAKPGEIIILARKTRWWERLQD
jgi:hypothetical protein